MAGAAKEVARSSMTARPPFMSAEPTPHRVSPSMRASALPSGGTVSRCPATRSRCGRPSCVRATTLLPTRSTSRCGRPARRPATWSAIASSSWLTEAIATSSAVRTSMSVIGGEATATVAAVASGFAQARIATCHRGRSAGPAVCRAGGRARLRWAAVSETSERPVGAWGVGLATVTPDGRILDTWYPRPALGLAGAGEALRSRLGTAAAGGHRLDADVASSELGIDVAAALGPQPLRRVERVAVATFLDDLFDPPVDAHDVYLRLHLLSHRLVAPHGLNLDGQFGILSNVAWTSAGPCAVEGLEDVRLAHQVAGVPFQVSSVDKFPRMTDYVMPTGVRIADADRVRLGAHLASGTTVMHEGFVNFNAGTLGVSMVEGRISAGVVVGDGSDIGGGASIMGTLSGGGREVVSVGKSCLLGANSGLGISLGDDCVVEAGLYVTAGTKVQTADGQTVKARELSGANNLLFRRNSLSGAVEVVARDGSGITLNEALHAN